MKGSTYLHHNQSRNITLRSLLESSAHAHRPWRKGRRHLNRPADTLSNSSEFPPGLPRECLSRRALYVASPKPGHAGRKVPFEKASVSAPVLTAFTIARERTENKMLEAITDSNRFKRGSCILPVLRGRPAHRHRDKPDQSQGCGRQSPGIEQGMNIPVFILGLI
jgi:hypothetical protein